MKTWFCCSVVPREGGRILVNTDLLAETHLWESTSNPLRAELWQIVRIVPAKPLAEIRYPD